MKLYSLPSNMVAIITVLIGAISLVQGKLIKTPAAAFYYNRSFLNISAMC